MTNLPNWPNPTRATVLLPVDAESENVRKLLTILFGEGAVPEYVAHVVGALDNAIVNLSASPDGRQLIARIEHPDFEHWERHIRRDQQGSTCIWNEKMRIKSDKQSGGIGASRLRQEVENAYYIGIAYIACHAARFNAVHPNDASRAFHGYYVWPRLGFDQGLDKLANGTENAEDVRKGTPAAFPDVAEAIRRQFGDEVTSIQQLWNKRGGREWWKTHGVELYHAVFDLAEQSYSLQVFNDYWREKGEQPLCLTKFN